jgi:hypothetical protein
MFGLAERCEPNLGLAFGQLAVHKHALVFVESWVRCKWESGGGPHAVQDASRIWTDRAVA